MDKTLIMRPVLQILLWWFIIGVTRYFGSASEFEYSKTHQKFNESLGWTIIKIKIMLITVVLGCVALDLEAKYDVSLDKVIKPLTEKTLSFCMQYRLIIMMTVHLFTPIPGIARLHAKRLRLGNGALSQHEKYDYQKIVLN